MLSGSGRGEAAARARRSASRGTRLRPERMESRRLTTGQATCVPMLKHIKMAATRHASQWCQRAINGTMRSMCILSISPALMITGRGLSATFKSVSPPPQSARMNCTENKETTQMTGTTISCCFIFLCSDPSPVGSEYRENMCTTRAPKRQTARINNTLLLHSNELKWCSGMNALTVPAASTLLTTPLRLSGDRTGVCTNTVDGPLFNAFTLEPDLPGILGMLRPVI
mmetsp:Transcript_87792/g.160655  ORF Transcript_87792/g.160655 Transcript_87792/m.160655 type:complete len:227 (-) Transcript_87792:1816-2496(-)